MATRLFLLHGCSVLTDSAPQDLDRTSSSGPPSEGPPMNSTRTAATSKEGITVEGNEENYQFRGLFGAASGSLQWKSASNSAARLAVAVLLHPAASCDAGRP